MSRAGVGGARPGRPSTSAGPGPESALPSALACLSLLCRERNVRFNRRGLREALADEPTLDLDAVVRCARRAGLSIDTGPASAKALRHPRSPVLMRRREGRFVLVAAMDDNNAWLLEPRTGNARPVPGAAFVDACHDEAAFLAESTDTVDETFTLRSVAGHVLRHKAELGPLVATSFFISLLGFVYPLVFLIVIDKVVSNRGTATLDVLIGGLLFFLAFEAVLRGARHKVLRHAVRNVDRSLLSRLIRHALDLPASFHLRNSAVETLSRIEELRHLRRFLTNAVVFVFVDILFVFVFLGLMLNFSAALALIVLASLPLYVAPAFAMMPALRRKRRRTRTTRRDSNEAVLDTFNGIDTVKGMHAEHPQEGFVVRRLDDAVSSEEDSEDLRASMTQYNQFVNRLAIAGLLWFGASMVLDGQLTLGQLVAINILNMRFSQPMMRLCMFVYDFSQLRAIVTEVGEILNEPSERGGGCVHPVRRAQGRNPFRGCPVGLVKTVKPFEQGKMRRIAAEEGSVVDAGDILIEFDTTLVDAVLAKLTAELAIKSVEAARLESLLGWRRRAPFNPPVGAPREIVAINERLVADQIESHRARLHELDGQIAERGAQIATLGARVAKLEALLPVRRELTEMQGALYRTNHGSRIRLLEAW